MLRNRGCKSCGVLSIAFLVVLSFGSKATANTLVADCDGWHLFSPTIPEQGSAYLRAVGTLFIQTGVDEFNNPIFTSAGTPIVVCALVPDVDANPLANDAGYDFQVSFPSPLGDGTYRVSVTLSLWIIDDPLNAAFDLAYWTNLAASCGDPTASNPAPTRRRRNTFVSEPFVCDNGIAQGCTPGFWKQPHHLHAWPASLSPNDLFVTVFGENAFPGLTLFQVVALTGGDLNALGRHTVAALLNASTLGAGSYGLSPAQVIAMFNAVFPGTKSAYNGLKDTFEGLNEQGCPFGSGAYIDEELALTLPVTFRRGDSNTNGRVDISDAVFILEGFFVNPERQSTCADAVDVNDDGDLDVSDPIGLLQALFMGAAPIRFPGNEYCGVDLAEDSLPECTYSGSCTVE